jgi:hypothetical protein
MNTFLVEMEMLRGALVSGPAFQACRRSPEDDANAPFAAQLQASGSLRLIGAFSGICASGGMAKAMP